VFQTKKYLLKVIVA